MNSQKAIRILSFAIILGVTPLPVESTHAGPARSIMGSAFGVPGDTGAVTWNTFLGTATYDDGYDIAIDASENLYITGVSDSTWGSPIINAHTAGLGFDAFVAKMDGSGNVLWNTYLGGSGDDMGLGIALDGSGNIFVGGSSAAAWGSPKRAFTSGSPNVFVAKLDSGGTLLWNTFFPRANAIGDLFGLAVDSSGNVYISADSSATWGTPIRAYAGGFYDAFVAKLDGDGTLIWNTFLGGSDGDQSFGLALDSSGKVYVSGVSMATWGNPTRAFTASVDTFVAKLDSDGALQWNTFLGGTGQDHGFGIVVDGRGVVYITGISEASWGTPLSPISTTNQTFVARLDANGTLIWNTFALGSGHGITADASGYIYVSGFAFPSKAFALKLDPAGTPVWSTLMESTGASDWIFATRVVVGGSGNVYLVGFSPSTWGTPLNAFAGGDDAFIAKLQNVVAPPITIAGNAGIGGTTLTYSVDAPQQAIADQQGHYILSVPNGWTGTVTPTLSGCTFTPPNRPYTNISADLMAENYSPACTATLSSAGALDGWVLESTETSGKGGKVNPSARSFNLGDDAMDRQYRGILSFDTSGLTVNAVVTKATLMIKKQGLVGTNPFSTHGGLKVDIASPYLGTSAALALNDFQALADKNAVATFGRKPATGGWYSAVLSSAAYPYINLTGTTQFRLRFGKDDNDDLSADYLKFYSGNALIESNRPILVIEYYVP